MHRTKQELFEDVHLPFLDDLERCLPSFWPNNRTSPILTFDDPKCDWLGK